jgi:hypothetical protein
VEEDESVKQEYTLTPGGETSGLGLFLQSMLLQFPVDEKRWGVCCSGRAFCSLIYMLVGDITKWGLMP